ncbi:helix-turn-helix domain-containing protein [Paenibacillus sp. FSL M7-0656]|uniref:helix-turn-helix domain-containing protein n=1 Tax=Paenibacillus sp. FSL M7-0656 TaxID=2921534 RepID=UPI0030F5B9FF
MYTIVPFGEENKPKLPPQIGDVTLNELMKMKDVEVSIKDNTLKAKKITPTETLTLEVKLYPDGIEKTERIINRPYKKKELRATVVQFLREGKTQSEIAYILDMSQSYVSKLIKKAKEKGEI